MVFKMKSTPYGKSALKGKGESGTHKSHHPGTPGAIDVQGGFARMDQEHLEQTNHSHHHPKEKQTGKLLKKAMSNVRTQKDWEKIK